jgi:ribosomal protein S20
MGVEPMSNVRTVGLAGALVISALVGGTLISAVAAAPAPSAPDPVAVAAAPSGGPARAAGEYCTAFRAAFAADLGVTEAEMVAAARKAAASTIDKAVADGDLTKAAADRLKARLEAAPADGCALFSGWRAKVTKAVVDVARDGLTAAADALKLTPNELRAELHGGKSLKDVAAAHGVPYATLTDAIVAAVKADLDAAVAAGSLKQARADRILERLKARLADGRLRPARPAASSTTGR